MPSFLLLNSFFVISDMYLIIIIIIIIGLRIPLRDAARIAALEI